MARCAMACSRCGKPTVTRNFALCTDCWQADRSMSSARKNRLIAENGQLKQEIATLTALLQEIFNEINNR